MGKLLRHRTNIDYCGCCGRECLGEWCDDCAKHVKPTITREPWDMTYFAQFNEDCPYQTAEKKPW